MGCCASKNKKSKDPVVVTFFGATGEVGGNVIGPFFEALDDGRIQELRVATRDTESDAIQKFIGQGAKAYQVSFGDKMSLADCLSGTSTVVSCMGTGPGTQEANEILIQAMADAEVPTYLPSEFGTNHYKLPDVYQHPILKMKRSIYEKSKAAGINTIRILCGDLLEGTFGPWFGFDNTAEVWTIVGSGDVQVAMTSMKDVGRFALEAVLLVHNGTFIPDELEVFSCQKTIKEYAAIFDSVAGTDTTLEFVDLQKAKEDYQNSQEFLDLLKLLFAEGVYDYTKSKGNSILNPGEKRWKLRTVEDYAQETGGRPYKQ